MPKKSIKDLNKLIEDSTSTDKILNEEQRTNIQLFLGNHFYKTRESLSRSLENIDTDNSKKIRITKNHIYKISEYIINAILSTAGDVGIFPRNASEVQDQKSAELHNSVLSKWKEDIGFEELLRDMAYQFVIPGEIVTKRFWNPNRGEIVGEEIRINEMGEQVSIPVRAGEVEVELIYPWDLKRPTNSKRLEDMPWIGYEKMVSTKELQSQVDDPDLKKQIRDSEDETFKVIDPTTGIYRESKGRTLVREVYYKPSAVYPNGYYYIFTKDIILYEGELEPGHPFPIKVKGYTNIPTSPRSVSIIRQLRPLQVEVNRGASSQALVQLSVGLPKVVTLAGSTIESGGMKSGLRIYKSNGMQAPVIIPGQSGAQFVDSMNQAITEMYQISNVPEIAEDKVGGLDPQTAMYIALKDKKRFSLVAKKFQEYVKDLIKDVLTLKKIYMNPAEIVQVVGRSEAINVSEFKNAKPIGFQIKLEDVSDDIASTMGKYINIRDMLQYGAGAMNGEQVALLGRNMPFLNDEKMFESQLVNYDNYVNIQLSIERGEQIVPTMNDDADYLLPKLQLRTRRPDFKFLEPQVQQMYGYWIEQLELMQAQKAQQLKVMQSQMIPTSGGNVPIPIYQDVPNSTGGFKSERIKVPHDALVDLVKKLQSQGATLETMNELQDVNASNIAQLYNQQQPEAQPQLV
ncbi:MAG: hypothetical protein N4A33_04795 [Bacteriovoracaceae bacterium]|jgi:hypothetical protein|nr:hypothetical protein [Bacteriovoracaceae bacterium]